MESIITKDTEVFYFKNFGVAQDPEVFKITTDSLALGALCPLAEGYNNLEIGGGTGVVSMMLAQRFDNIHVATIDINPRSVELSKENFANSSYGTRLSARQEDFCDFVDTLKDNSLDNIVSNPPYHTNGLMPSDEHLALAKHESHDLLPNILSAAKRLLKPDGLLSLLIPAYRHNEIIKLADSIGLYLHSRVKLTAFENQPPIRYILSWQPNQCDPIEDRIVTIYNPDRSYHASWRIALADFLTIF